ncbi:class I SAM-dependent methyltransferase [Nocardia cerradoensis]|uniref:class I SAM-dependent methyltransferase n=1 Tax=Nocardia cerradoensis TaxID=85688 RepID=UPI001B352FE1|nr:SAM-dependent methyltransferase [Nocardia cerradoensis]
MLIATTMQQWLARSSARAVLHPVVSSIPGVFSSTEIGLPSAVCRPNPRRAAIQILCFEILLRRSEGYLPMATDKADTSFMPMVIAACEQRESPQQRLLTDGLAATMLPAPLRALLGLRVVRTRLAVLMDRDAPGIWNSIACRKRYLDDAVAQAIADGIAQIVVLGAGFDTRAARFTAASEVTAVEVDLPRTVARKRRRLGDSRVVLAPIDFEHDDLATVLTDHGYDPAHPAIIVWEGVTQYLTADAVHDTLHAFDSAASGTRLAFTYVRQEFLDGTELYDAPGLRRRFVDTGVWRFGLRPAEVAELLSCFGWHEHEQVGRDEYRERYLEPVGRIGPVSPVERCVAAVKN